MTSLKKEILAVIGVICVIFLIICNDFFVDKSSIQRGILENIAPFKKQDGVHHSNQINTTYIQQHKICTQQTRRNNIKDMCKLYNNPGSGGARLVVDDKRQIAYCFIQKSGCSTWKALMSNISSNGAIQHEVRKGEIHGRIGKYGLHYSRYNKNYENYTKFMVMRHPFDRLLSAYFDKMRTPNHWTKKQILVRDTYRTDKNLTMWYATFIEFIKMILDDPVHTISGNIHWNPYISRCSPCHIDYQYILKLETMNHDMTQLLSEVYNNESTVLDQLEKLKRQNTYQINKSKRMSQDGNSDFVKTKVLEHDFATLSSDVVKKLADKYNLEMKFLGYSYSQDTKGTYYAHCAYENEDCC